jgi:hypothetical protein
MSQDQSDNDGSFSLNIIWVKNAIEVETLEVDLFGMLAAVGGILALFVGFSCLNLIFAILDCFKEHFYNPEE